MFKKGQFIRSIGTENVCKVIKVTKDPGNNRVYVLRPKGARSDKYDFEERIDYVNKEYELERKHNIKRDCEDLVEFLLGAL